MCAAGEAGDMARSTEQRATLLLQQAEREIQGDDLSICLPMTVFFAFCGIELAVEHSRLCTRPGFGVLELTSKCRAQMGAISGLSPGQGLLC